ncbi:MAG: 30S ribosomal protein S6 [Candidatus Parcubacteria bacterium]|nr:30S ribosomal protein S6 [Candidatus Parcubacteria bacterium]
METEQKMYEIGYLLSPLIPEEKLDEEIGSLRKLIEDKKGFILNEGRPKMQKLAYPIKKLETAYFGWIKFTADPSSLPEIKSPQIIRFLITEVIKTPPAKKIIKKKKTLPAGVISGIKEGIKFEEIDKKLEELLGKSE